jgi:hypothetical protein
VDLYLTRAITYKESSGRVPLPTRLGVLRYSPMILINTRLRRPSVELAIKNLLPRTEVEFTRRDRDHNLPPHNLAFHMGIGIVLAGSVVTIA